MSDESDDPSDSSEDAGDDADQSDASPDSDGGVSEQGRGDVDGPDNEADASDVGDDDTGGEGGEQGDVDSGESGQRQEGTEEDGAGERGDVDSGERTTESAGDSGDGRGGGGRDGTGDRGGADPERVKALAEELGATREQLADLESRVDEKTVHRDDVMAELKRYVRARQRRGHATGWGPYIVLLYGTAMSLGAFYYLGGWPVIAALVVIWLSTLGLFVVMLLAGTLVGAGRKLGSARDIVGMLRR